ncbi:MAG: hypothetical protein ISP32_02920 [Thermoleophilia bacterium]|nr:hypothetical protein [Thermoleophilia bacterium]
MWALYCTRSDAVQVFIPDEWANTGGYTEQPGGGVLVDVDHGGVPMGVAVMEPLQVDLTRVIPGVAHDFGLDADAVIAAMRAALAAPDREVTIDVRGTAA